MIIIPSYGRPESVLTLSSFEPALLRETTLVVHPREADHYRRNYSVRVVSTTEQGKGAAVVRQYILDKGKRGEGGESAGTNREEAHRLAAAYLAYKYPRYIRIRDASNNSAHMENIRCPVDITFYSKKAYKELIK